MIESLQAIAAIVVIAGAMFLTAIIIYLWFFALAYFVNRNRSLKVPTQPQTRFAFVVPAHNEEKNIARTVTNLLAVDYPQELFDVVVIADNCSDNTMAKAVEVGARCLQRNDSKFRGKGYALRYAFDDLITKDYAAFIIIDADSIVSKNCLSSMSARLQQGEQVVQGYYGMSNPDASILTYLFQIGNLIENKLFWEAKQIFGLPIILRGNGMCFSKQIIERYPWDAFSIVEDTEYGIKLVDKDIHIHFAPEVGVFAHQPETLEQAFAQRVRWASGNSSLTKGRALGLIIDGISRKNICLADLGVSLIIGSKPMLLMINGVLLLLALLTQLPILIWWTALLLFAQILYIGIGVVLNGINQRNLLMLLGSPFYLGWLCIITVLGLMGFRKNQWVRTTRQ